MDKRRGKPGKAESAANLGQIAPPALTAYPLILAPDEIMMTKGPENPDIVLIAEPAPRC